MVTLNTGFQQVENDFTCRFLHDVGHYQSIEAIGLQISTPHTALPAMLPKVAEQVAAEDGHKSHL